VPPQQGPDIARHMTAFEVFINEDTPNLDPLVKMALLHHQFESIHPFPDGNGRIGRILNVLFITREGLLDIPILYLSRAINRTKNEYYRQLQAVRETGDWQPWVLYMLKAVEETSYATLSLVEGIRDLMQEYKVGIRNRLPKLHSQDLLNNLFRHPYTRIEYMQNDLGRTRQTAAKYLEELTEAGFLSKLKGDARSVYYVNRPLVALLQKGSGEV
jgi:Fic family protein